MSTATSQQHEHCTDLFEGISGLLHRGLTEQAICTIISRLGGDLPLSDPRYAAIELEKRIFRYRVRKISAHTLTTFSALAHAAGKIEVILK